MENSYRIISIEASDIYKSERENGDNVGNKLPDLKGDAYFRLFKNKLDYSLDSIELEKVYPSICRKKLAIQDKYGNKYTLAVINVKFNYTYKPTDNKPITLKQLRKHFYENGFNIGGIHYCQ